MAVAVNNLKHRTYKVNPNNKNNNMSHLADVFNWLQIFQGPPNKINSKEQRQDTAPRR